MLRVKLPTVICLIRLMKILPENNTTYTLFNLHTEEEIEIVTQEMLNN